MDTHLSVGVAPALTVYLAHAMCFLLAGIVVITVLATTVAASYLLNKSTADDAIAEYLVHYSFVHHNHSPGALVTKGLCYQCLKHLLW